MMRRDVPLGRGRTKESLAEPRPPETFGERGRRWRWTEREGRAVCELGGRAALLTGRGKRTVCCCEMGRTGVAVRGFGWGDWG